MRRSAVWAAYYNALANPLTEIFGIAMLLTAMAVTSYLILNRATSVFGIKLTSEPLTVPSMMVFFGFLLVPPIRCESSPASSRTSTWA